MLLFFVVLCPIGSKDTASLGVDMGTLYDIVSKKEPELNVAFRMRLSQTFEMKLPFGLSFGSEGQFLSLGIDLLYYPYETGPFVGLSLLGAGFELGSHYLSDRIINLNEISIGWTWNFMKQMYAEASLTIRDPSGICKKQYDAILGTFTNYTTYRFRLLVGWNFISEE